MIDQSLARYVISIWPSQPFILIESFLSSMLILYTHFFKNMAATPQELALRKEDEFYKSADIEVCKNSKVVKVDSNANTVETQTGELFRYDYLVLATGGKPRTLEIASGIPNVYLLRAPEDGNAIG